MLSLDSLTGNVGACIIVVDPGRPDVYRALAANFRDRVILDRRVGERRRNQRRTGRLAPTAPGRRQGERRRTLAATWKVHGFVLAPASKAE